MAKSSTTSTSVIFSTLIFGIICIAINGLISFFKEPEVPTTQIIYYPPEAEAVNYTVATKDIQRLGDCVSFPNSQGENITLCDSYEEVGEKQ